MSANAQPPLRTGLLDFLRNSSGSQFVIPVYQRNYTWSAGKEVKQYLDDLKSVLLGEYNNHFLGIIIYLDTPIDFTSREFSVIDGQQRLTTTFLILYAIREIMKQENAVDAIQSLDGQILTNPFATHETLKYKLKPLVSDDSVYKYIVNDKAGDIEDTDSLVYKNFKYIVNYVKTLNEKFTYNEILLALNKLYVVCIPLSKEDNAQKIFESINSTGVKLTASDLIRNFLLMDLNSELQDLYYTKYWMELEKYLGSDSKKLESFFRFYLSIKNKVLPNKNAVYREFVHWYKKNQDVEREAIFDDIIKYSRYYYEIYYKDLAAIEKALRGPIKEYRRILSDMPAPLMMGLWDLYEKGKISIAQTSEMIYIINSYLIRRALCDLNTSYLTKMFPPLLKDIEEECAGDYKNVVEVLKKNLVFKNSNNGMYVPNDKQLRDILLHANVYKIKTPLRIFFDKLEHHDNPAPVHLEDLNIEHLMPQTPTPEWYEALGVDEEEYQRNVSRLGNLTLASKVDNSRMQNKVWTYKNEILSNTSHLKINQDILKKEKWDIHAIHERTEFLIQAFNKLFSYPQTNSKIIKTTPIYIDANGVSASGMFYADNGAVEIYEGSELALFKNADNYPEINEERQNLIDDGIIYDDGEKLVFKRSHIVNPKIDGFSALSSSASLSLHGSRNGWDCWKTSDGVSLREKKEIL